MNFGQVIKSEIISKNIKDKCCRLAFIAGFVRGAGRLIESDGEIGLEFNVVGEETFNYISSLIRNVFSYDVREIFVTENVRHGNDKFTVSIIGDGAEDIIESLGILVRSGDEYIVNLKMYDTIAEKDCCLRSFIRGLFVAVGNCTVPIDGGIKTNYHLEIPFFHNVPAFATMEKLESVGVSSRITRRKGTFVLYIKSGEEIKNFVAFLSAPVSVLKLTDIMINREISNTSNRQKNCDIANINKQIEASIKQTEAIKKLMEQASFKGLKEELKATAIARIENPDCTLNELAEILNITKSCLNHRLRKLVSLAEDTNE